MEYLIEKIKKYYKYLIIILVVILILFVIFFYNNENTSDDKSINSKIDLEVKTEKNEEKAIKKIKVDIKGAINNPGVYEVDENSRVIDVINSANGLREDANITLLNLSKKVKDQDVIIIYTNDEVATYKETKVKTEYVYIEVESCPDPINSACIKEYENNEENS